MNWSERLSNGVTERNCLMVLVTLFVLLSIVIAAVPYNPSTDMADATTNNIWLEQYSHGIHYIPYDEWSYGQTQSVVVEYHGQDVVVNEKGPGHVVMMLPFYMTGLDILFGPFMVALALLGTYMLGKRLFGWQVGFIASLLVLFNLVVMVMWHRSYWTDASTMHLLVLAVWLMVEGNYRYNGRTLDPSPKINPHGKDKIMGLSICILSGLAFGLSVSTRYPTGLLIIVFLAYLFGFYFLRVWPALKKKDFHKIFNDAKPFLFLLGAFSIGLFIVLVPLTHYNSTYFGGPFNSGYDATSLMDFSRTGTLNTRNTTSGWTSNLGSDISTALRNFIILLPMFISRMPALLFVPIGIYCLRKRKLEMAVLLLWIGINFFTYLSLEWVNMYARQDLVPWEPRYWLPSLPAITLLGGVGIYQLANWIAKKKDRENRWQDYEKRAAKILIVGAITGMIILWGAVPAATYFQNPNVQMGPNQHPPNAQAQLVTTDMLLANPQTYLEKPVMLEDAVIVGSAANSIEIRSQNSSYSDSVTVRFIDWSPGTLPQFSAGQHVWLRGMFMRDAAPNQPPDFSVMVKYGTPDYVRLTSM